MSDKDVTVFNVIANVRFFKHEFLPLFQSGGRL